MTESENVRLARFEEKLDHLLTVQAELRTDIKGITATCPKHGEDIAKLKTQLINIEDHTLPGMQSNIRELFNRNWAAVFTALMAVLGAVLSFVLRNH